MARMSKAERVYAVQEAYDEMVLKAKQDAQAEMDVKKEQKSSEQVLKEWEAVKEGADNWNAMEKWLRNQSDSLKKREQIKTELQQEIESLL
jgi:hypothetical protein